MAAAVTFQGADNSGSSNSTSLGPFTPFAGTTIFIFVTTSVASGAPAGASAVSDNVNPGNYTPVGTLATNVPGGGKKSISGQWWYHPNALPQATTITTTTADTGCGGVAYALAGVTPGATVVPSVQSATGATTALTTPNINVTTPGSMILAAWADANAATGLSPFISAGANFTTTGFETCAFMPAGSEHWGNVPAGLQAVSATALEAVSAWVGVAIVINPGSVGIDGGQGIYNTGGSSSKTCTVIVVTPGAAVFVFVGTGVASGSATGASSVSDPVNGQYTPIGLPVINGVTSGQWWYALNCPAVSVSVTVVSADPNCAMVAYSLVGVAVALAFAIEDNQSAVGSVSNMSLTTPNLTVLTKGSGLLAGWVNAATPIGPLTAGSGWSSTSNENPAIAVIGTENQMDVAVGTFGVTATANANQSTWVGAAIAIYPDTPIAFANSGSNSNGASASVTVNATISAGDTVVVSITSGGIPVASVTDNAGNVYYQRGGTGQVDSSTWTELWATDPSAAAAATQVTVTWASATDSSITVATYTNVIEFGNIATPVAANTATPTVSVPIQDSGNVVAAALGSSSTSTTTWAGYLGSLRANVASSSGTTTGAASADNTAASPALVTVGTTLSAAVNTNALAIELRKRHKKGERSAIALEDVGMA